MMKKPVSILFGLLLFASTVFAQAPLISDLSQSIAPTSTADSIVQDISNLIDAVKVEFTGEQTLAPLSRSFEIMQRAEVKSNGVAVRNDTPVAIEHFEIPLDKIAADISKDLSKEIEQSLVFEKNGKKYLRWIINPEDTRWHLEIEEWLKANKIPVVKGKHFTGYQTASRSYIVRDPVSGVEFSAKVSTNRTGGNWTDKKQTWEDAWQVRMAYEHIEEAMRQRGGLKNSVWISEPAAFGIEALDHGMLIRSYDSMKDGKTILVPGFAVLHEEFGREVARLNGSNDPAKFWNDNYNKPLARALAEVYAISGMQYDSPHSQNFMVELDANMKPTGRIGLRDMGDAYMTTDVFVAAGRADIPKRWEADNVLRGYLAVSAGLLHGNKDPSWMDTATSSTERDSSYNRWGVDFYRAFEAEFFNITGVDLTGTARMSRGGKYFSKSYQLNTQTGQRYLQWVRDGRPVLSPMCMDTYRPAM